MEGVHAEKWSNFTIEEVEEEVEYDFIMSHQFMFNGVGGDYPPCNFSSPLDLLSYFWEGNTTTALVPDQPPEAITSSSRSSGGGELYPVFSMPQVDQQPIHCPIADLLLYYDEEQNKKKRNTKPKKKKKLGSIIDDNNETKRNPPLDSSVLLLLPQGLSSSSSISEDDDDSFDTSLNNPTTTALQNSSGKRKSRQKNPTSEPPSLYARRRRERINERLRILQNLVPNGTKVDISTMLEEAVHYVKFLQLQIKLLSSDELWMYAPITYNGRNIGLDLTF